MRAVGIERLKTQNVSTTPSEQTALNEAANLDLQQNAGVLAADMTHMSLQIKLCREAHFRGPCAICTAMS